MTTEILCACGRPLHYENDTIREQMEQLVAENGEHIKVTRQSRTWLVPRHYIALHGLNAEELPFLGFEEVVDAE
jgi:hypothetical protein